MTLEKVIELGKKAEVSYDIELLNQPAWVWFLVWGSILVLIIALVIELKGFNEVALVLGAMAILLLLIGGFGFLIHVDLDMDDGVSKWKEEVATPYINSLPVEEKEVIFIKIDPELSNKTSGGLFYTYSSDVEKTPITVSFKDNGKIVTKTEWIEADMELSDTEKPYVEFQRLEKDLGHNVDVGIYNMKVHLPEDYTFTEIK